MLNHVISSSVSCQHFAIVGGRGLLSTEAGRVGSTHQVCCGYSNNYINYYNKKLFCLATQGVKYSSNVPLCFSCMKCCLFSLLLFKGYPYLGRFSLKLGKHLGQCIKYAFVQFFLKSESSSAKIVENYFPFAFVLLNPAQSSASLSDTCSLCYLIFQLPIQMYSLINS